jgi:threonyl-tRNA synthetase
LDRPLEGDVTLKFLKFDEDDEAKQVFWHSSAHILGEACERFCGGHLCYGPPIAEGFYYDMHLEGSMFNQEDLVKLKKICDHVVKVRFFRLNISIFF